MNLPVLSNFRMRLLPRAVAFGHEDVAVGRRDDVVGLIEEVRCGCAAGLAERQQQLAVGAELEHLVALRRARPRCRTGRPRRARRRLRRTGARRAARRAAAGGALSWPSVTQMLPSRSTWMPCGKMSMPGAEALDQLAGRVELAESVEQVRHLAGRPVEAAVRAAALGDPDRSCRPWSIVDGARRSPRTTLRQLRRSLRCSDTDSARRWWAASRPTDPIWRSRRGNGRNEGTQCRELHPTAITISSSQRGRVRG